MKNKKLIFSVLFTGILLLNTFLFTDINENRLQLNSLFTLATAQTENVENGENFYSSYDCKGEEKESRTIYKMGNDLCKAYRFKCEGTTGPCCEGWLVCYYELVPGQSVPPTHKMDERTHTHCETVN